MLLRIPESPASSEQRAFPFGKVHRGRICFVDVFRTYHWCLLLSLGKAQQLSERLENAYGPVSLHLPKPPVPASVWKAFMLRENCSPESVSLLFTLLTRAFRNPYLWFKYVVTLQSSHFWLWLRPLMLRDNTVATSVVSLWLIKHFQTRGQWSPKKWGHFRAVWSVLWPITEKPPSTASCHGQSSWFLSLNAR